MSALERRMVDYGTLPDWEEFITRYNDVYGDDDDEFSGTNDPYLGEYLFTTPELYDQLEIAAEKWEDGNDDAGDWASAVLGLLGIEWV